MVVDKCIYNVAKRTVKVVYLSILDIGCFAHTLDRVGERFKFPFVSLDTPFVEGKNWKICVWVLSN